MTDDAASPSQTAAVEPLENDQYIASQNRVIQGRVEKMREFADAGIPPYANGFKPADTAAGLLAAHDEKEKEALEAQAITTSVAGRIMFVRSFGKAAFIKVKDRSGIIQAHVRKADLGDDAYAHFKKLDVGDIVGVSGQLFRTRTNELTIRASSVLLLTKSLRPLPEKFQGLTDVETRFRQRYVDLTMNVEVVTIFQRRAAIVRYIRDYLETRGFLEVETPMMHATPGGAAAKPFITHHNALDIDLFLRIAPELYLKRLLVGGLERVYEINRNFRNEGLSRRHNPEFTMLEFYWAYATYEDLMDMTEDMVGGLCQTLHGSDTLEWQGQTVSLARPWRRLRVREGVAQACGVDEASLSQRDVLVELVRALPDAPSPARIEGMGNGYLLMEIFEQRVEGTLVNPTFVTEYPSETSPLSRRNDQDPDYVDRFELVVAGMEIANAFSELNDPLDQRQRFLDQLNARQLGDDEAHPMDEDYIRALEYGMPPAAGEGIGIDRLVMLLTGAESIREVILFPQLRPE